ncbi:MAG: hypothetical protein IMZ60_02530, partial [Actinobacteria bacterium]|nr:hypothetical protein [Actinomycetota bacterium]
YVTGVIKYTSSSYAVETYNIQKDNLANYPKNISLYNLPSSSTTLFKMKYLGDNSIPKESYLLQIEREYVSEGNYSITEIPITSSVGTALANIDLTNNKYKIKVYDENNNLVKTYLDYTFMCDNALVSLCEVDLETIQKISPGQSFLQSEDTTLLTGINETTDVLTSEFETISGEPDTYTLIITKIEPNNITEIVNKELYTSKGSLSEDLSPYLDDQITTFNVIVEKGGRIIQNQPLEVDKLEGNFGRNNALLGLAILLFFFGIGVSSGLVLIVMTFVAVIVTGLTYLFNGLGIYSGIASLGSLIVVVIIIIVKISKRQN